MTGHLFVCATPIGNLGDASPRLAETLASVDVVYAEDTRRSRTLLEALGVGAELRSSFAGNEQARAAEIERELRAGRSVAVVTDAGTPSVSDPGALAVRAAREAGAAVTVVPGPSAITAAVAGSGFVDGPFVFAGFLAKKGTERSAQLQALAAEARPTVLFLTPHRIGADLTAAAEACGPDRQVCVARELTKLHEEWWWGTLEEAAAHWSEVAGRGEFTVVVDGAAPVPVDPDDAEALAARYVEDGATPSQASRRAAAETGVDRRAIYDALVRRNAGRGPQV